MEDNFGMDKIKINELFQSVHSERLTRIEDCNSPEFRAVARNVIHNHEMG